MSAAKKEKKKPNYELTQAERHENLIQYCMKEYDITRVHAELHLASKK